MDIRYVRSIIERNRLRSEEYQRAIRTESVDIPTPEQICDYNLSGHTRDDIMFEFKLQLNVDRWGRYKKGDIETFYIKLFDGRCGLTRHPIDEQWDIISYKIVSDESRDTKEDR